MAALTGIVLAAGAGTRMGRPKALMRAADGTPWLHLACSLLTEAGCDRIIVVLGAGADDAEPLVPEGVEIVRAERWAEGMGASLRAGLAAASGVVGSLSLAALVTLVDLPGLPVSVAHRVLEGGIAADSVRQAVFEGRPGHPVLIGRDHWAGLDGALSGDRGARAYLVAHGVTEVECADLFDGRDVDTA